MQNILDRIRDIWTPFYASLTVDTLLYAVLALLALLLLTLLVSSSRGRKIRNLQAEIESLSRAARNAPVPVPSTEPAAQTAVVEPAPVQVVESPCADRVLEMAKQLCDTADAAYETACREMDEQAQRTRAFYRRQQDQAYAVLKELRESSRVIRLPNPSASISKPEKSKGKPAKDDPYNLGSLDDLDEE